MGVKLMPLPEEPFIRFAGRLSDQERLQALEAATVVVVPSPYESLSLLALESFAVGTPVLANARSEVLVDHCQQQQRRAVLRGSRRVRRVPEAAGRRPAAARRDGPQRPPLRAPELPVGRDPRQVRAHVRAAAAAAGAGEPDSGGRSLSRCDRAPTAPGGAGGLRPTTTTIRRHDATISSTDSDRWQHRASRGAGVRD